MPRQPGKNRINMHDIVGQPLGSLPDAVDAVLRRPEPLDEVEVESIFYESSFILLRAEEAITAKDGAAFCALFKLFSEGFAHSETSFEAGIRAIAEQESLLQGIYSVFKVVVEQGALPLHDAGTVELIQVLSSLCDGESLKDRCGALFTQGLAMTLQRVYSDVGEAKRHFHVQRCVATALINLVKGSKQNKQRLSSWRFVADCCAASVDVFFQLQCVELLFRVSRQNKSVLTDLGTALPSSVVEGLRSLPNDGTLLSRMCSLIEEMNRDRAEVLRYPVSEVIAADTSLTSATNVYFTPYYLVIMITSTNADNITMPYRIVRSVTLGRDGRVILKLEEFPVKLEVLLSHAAGMDTVTLYMSLGSLAEFKQGPVRRWIVEALQSRKEEQRYERQQQNHASQGPERVEEGPKPGHGRHGDDANSSTYSSEYARKKVRHEDPGFAATLAGSSAASSSIPVAALMHVVDVLVDQSSTPNEAQALLLQLKRLVEARKEVLRGTSINELNEVMTQIQELVDEARRTAKDNRDAWQRAMLEELEDLDGLIVKAQEATAGGVEQLNEDLKKIKLSNQALNERIACMEIELQQTLEECRADGLRAHNEIEAFCVREAERQEFELDQRLLSRAQPDSLFSDYVRASAGRKYYS